MLVVECAGWDWRLTEEGSRARCRAEFAVVVLLGGVPRRDSVSRSVGLSMAVLVAGRKGGRDDRVLILRG